MNICFLEDTKLHGGTQIWVSEAIQFFINMGDKVTLLAPENSWIVDKCKKTKAEIFTYDWNISNSPKSKLKEIWTNAFRGCDLVINTVHPPRNGFHCSVFAAKCIDEAKLKTRLIQKTGTLVSDYRSEFYLPTDKEYASVITITATTSQHLIENYQIPEEKIQVIYQGTDINRFQSNPNRDTVSNQRYPFPIQASPKVGCIGTFEKRKGQSILLKSIAKLASGPLPNIHLGLLGDGPDEDKLRKICNQLNIQEHVSFFPFTNKPEFFFEQIDLTILPSIAKEGLPNVILESMAIGVPVIATPIGAITELIIEEKTGILVTPGDSDLLSEKILHLWQNDNLYQTIKTNAFNLIRDNFDKAKQFMKFYSHFDKLRMKV